MRLRGRREVAIDDVAAAADRHLCEPSLEAALEPLAARDRVWAALAELPEALRVTAMLRYSGSFPAYEEIELTGLSPNVRP